jgi:hypothetical protein
MTSQETGIPKLTIGQRIKGTLSRPTCPNLISNVLAIVLVFGDEASTKEERWLVQKLGMCLAEHDAST